MSEEIAFRLILAKRMLIVTIGVFALLLLLYALKGIDSEESEWLFGILTPLNTLYASAALKFVLSNKNHSQLSESVQDKTLPQYKSITTILIYLHLGIVYLILILTAFNLVTFEFTKYSLSTIETVFALYMGQVVSDLFKTA